jgi:hypothetical protein
MMLIVLVMNMGWTRFEEGEIWWNNYYKCTAVIIGGAIREGL